MPQADPVILDVGRNRLLRGSLKPAHLTPKETDVLALLAAMPGQVVSRGDLIKAAWAGNHLVGEQGLAKTIHGLREHLDDDPREPRFIRTVPRQGYQLVGSVSVRTPKQAETVGKRREGRTVARGAIAALMLLAGALLLAVARREPADEAGVRSFPRPLLNTAAAEGQPSAGGTGTPLLATTERTSHSGWDIRVREWPSLKLAHSFAGPADESAPAVAPDGRRIAYVVRDGPACQLRVFDLRAMAVVHELACDPVHALRIGWSPDSRRFFFNARDGIRVADAVDGTGALVVPAPPHRFFAKPEALGTDRVIYLVFSENSHLAPGIEIAEVSTGRVLTSSRLDRWASDLHVRQGRVYLASSRPGQAGIWEWDPASGERVRLSDEPAVDLTSIGDTLIFARVNADLDVCLTSRERGDCDPSLTSSATEAYPSFLYDGRYLAVLSNRDGGDALYLHEPANGTTRARIELAPEGWFSGPFEVGEDTLIYSLGETVAFHHLAANLTVRQEVPGLARLLGAIGQGRIVFQDHAGGVCVLRTGRAPQCLLEAATHHVLLDPATDRLFAELDEDGTYAVFRLESDPAGDTVAVPAGERRWPSGRPLWRGSDIVFAQRGFDETRIVAADGQVILALPDAYSVFGLSLASSREHLAYEYFKVLSEDVFALQL